MTRSSFENLLVVNFFIAEIIFQYHFTNLSNNEYLLSNEAKRNQTNKPKRVKVYELRYTTYLATSGIRREMTK